MLRRVAKYLAGLLMVLAAVWAAFTMAMRTKFPPVQDAVRRMNRAFVNPRQMHTAGQPGAYASVIRHVGRRSGAAYETPVQALATDHGFVVPLPYGSRPDWLRNVLAAGSATLVNEGNTYRVDHAEVISRTEAEPHFPPKYLRTHRWYGIDQFLEVRRVDVPEAEISERA